MRFDDMLATLLALPQDGAASRTAVWRQVVDVLAQRSDAESSSIEQAYALIRRLRGDVPAAVRAEAALALTGQPVPVRLLTFFAEEPPSICAPLIARAPLSSDAWIALLPMLTPTARSLLRHRRDLEASVRQALETFGRSDFAIAAPERIANDDVVDTSWTVEDVPATDAALTSGEDQIRALMARIDAFRREASVRPPPEGDDADDDEEAIEEFRFETGIDGVVLWIDGAPRGPLIGQSIAVAAERLTHGVDGHAAGAFRRRSPFRDARLTIAGSGAIGGEWRISAVPFFDPRDGRFTGYRGTGRRPRLDEIATPAGDTGLYGTGMQPDSLRQLIHELRTPLNAVVGFAEMIEQQLLGPAASGYRDRAATIARDGKRLLSAVDDLDMAARIESQRIALDAVTVDAAALLSRLHGDYEHVAADRGATLAFRIEAELPAVEADPAAVERMFARLLASTIGLAEPRERILVRLERAIDRKGHVQLVIGRPEAITGRDEHALLDPGYSPDGDWPDAPLLGLGFALRLVRNLAGSIGGSLEIGRDTFTLRMPIARGDARTGRREG